MTSENKYTMHIKLGLDEKLDSRILSPIIEDALLLYATKTGQKMTVAQMVIYEDFLNTLPNVDAVEVAHGKWIEDGESIYCSVCGFETSSMVPYVCDGEKWVPCYANKYCGNCGAKMDLK